MPRFPCTVEKDKSIRIALDAPKLNYCFIENAQVEQGRTNLPNRIRTVKERSRLNMIFQWLI